jgi:hypothetical protein|tara:strand:+ start:1783 stop:2079 length:297 start_codon:yes stop_codon:yes gene_type:complete
MKISKKEARKIIKGSGGQFLSVKFTKKNGEVRNLNGRVGVHKSKYAPLKNVGLGYNPKDYGLVGIFDVQRKAYRMININTLSQLKIGGEIYQIRKDII